jgi:hypothetical protein
MALNDPHNIRQELMKLMELDQRGKGPVLAEDANAKAGDPSIQYRKGMTALDSADNAELEREKGDLRYGPPNVAKWKHTITKQKMAARVFKRANASVGPEIRDGVAAARTRTGSKSVSQMNKLHAQAKADDKNPAFKDHSAKEKFDSFREDVGTKLNKYAAKK